MKIVQSEMTSSINSHFSLVEKDESFFKAPFHCHPEFELVYIVDSFGKRIIGDKIEEFTSGDMVFIGSGIPHLWKKDKIFFKKNAELKANAIVLYFNKNLFGPGFFKMKEAFKVNEFLQKASRGITIKGKTKEMIANKLKDALGKKNFQKIIDLLEILHILSESNEIDFISAAGYNDKQKHSQNDRLSEVYKFVQKNFKEHISLSTVANISNLTPQSFCRLFKKRSGKSFVEYLNEIRISAACSYLLDTDWPVSEIAYNCGYKTVSNFNKLFKTITGLSPKAYRETAYNLDV